MDQSIKQLIVTEMTKRMGRAPTDAELSNMETDTHIQIVILMRLVVNLRQRVIDLENKK